MGGRAGSPSGAPAAGRSTQELREAIGYRYYEYPAPHRVEPHCAPNMGIRTQRYKWIELPHTGLRGAL
ncbi:MAG: sulfatase/phosphatase domain-containing protein [Planctomycetia bacterium]